eukprot:5329002-Prymnesium_polylepis.1
MLLVVSPRSARWEEDRLRASGMVRMVEGQDELDEEELRTQVVVSDLKPPFLDGKTVLSKQSQPWVTPDSNALPCTPSGPRSIRPWDSAHWPVS